MLHSLTPTETERSGFRYNAPNRYGKRLMIWIGKHFYIFLATFCAAGGAIAAADPPRARTLTYDAGHRVWVELPPPPPGTPEGDLHLIRVHIKDGNYRRALSLIKRYIDKHGEADPLHPEILAAKAQALIGQGKLQKAHSVLQVFLNHYGGMEATSEALRLEFVIAETFLTGVKRRFLGIPMLSGIDLSYRIFDEISADYPQERIAEYAVKTKADHLFAVGEHSLAELEYSRLLTNYPQSRYQPFALRRSADAAIAAFRGAEYDDSPLIEAEERYHEYRGRYGGLADREGVGVILDGIHEKRAEKEFAIGLYYERTAHVSSAVFCYRSVVRDWPGTLAAGKAAARLELLGVEQPVISSLTPPSGEKP